MTKAIFFDIDGTLVSFESHAVPQSTIDAIKEVKQKGIKVIIATARLLAQVKDLGDLEFDGLITVNGSYCVSSKGEVIVKKTIARNELVSLMEYEKSVMPFAYAFMTEEGTFVNRIDERVYEVARLTASPIPQIRDMSTLLSDEVFQLKLYVDEPTEDKIMSQALKGCESSRWHESFVNVNVKGIDKSTGMDAFLNYYGIDVADTMAFGDGGNDIAMLKHAHIGVAMGNGGDDLKAVADYVTTSVDDNGVANALRHFGLIASDMPAF